MASNFPNMSYCAFENTAKGMDQCMEMIQEALDNDEPLNLSSYDERRHFQGMRQRCEEMLALLDQHDEMTGDVEEDCEPAGSYDLSDDAEALASAGMGMDEDY